MIDGQRKLQLTTTPITTSILQTHGISLFGSYFKIQILGRRHNKLQISKSTVDRHVMMQQTEASN
jgi:hypothetical protein